jgi:hypothetical protein
MFHISNTVAQMKRFAEMSNVTVQVQLVTGSWIPTVYCLLPDKLAATYLHVFKQIKSFIPGMFSGMYESSRKFLVIVLVYMLVFLGKFTKGNEGDMHIWLYITYTAS